jgi:glyoxylase-like metal-dependent hydrolase (beta-lactamase superfamily II)
MQSWHASILSSALGSVMYVLDLPPHRFIVDTGHPAASDKTLEQLTSHGLLDNITAIVLTHWHADHVGAAAQLCEATGAPLWAGAPSTNALTGREQHRLKLTPRPVQPQRILEDGEQIMCGTECIQVLATPGHCDDHLCFFIRDRRVLIGGDLMGYDDVGTLDTTYSYRQSIQSMRQSIQRCETLKPRQIFPGHGPQLNDPRWLFSRVYRRLEVFERSPLIMVSHTLMPLLLLLIDAHGSMSMEELRDYTADHGDFFHRFLDDITEEILLQELTKMVGILEVSGALSRENERYTLGTQPGGLTRSWRPRVRT